VRSSAANARWAISFADLCLLLLGFFVLLQAGGSRAGEMTDGVREAFGATAAAGRLDLRTADLFDRGEAVLRPAARPRLIARMRGAKEVRVESLGRDPDAGRFDGWELAAARVAAIARLARDAGVRAEAVTVAMPPIGGPARGQTIRVTRR
jgi:flagellar motor protein MotB